MAVYLLVVLERNKQLSVVPIISVFLFPFVRSFI